MQSLLLSDPEGRGNKEAMMSYVLAWTLKRASSVYSHEDPVLYKYCREILFKLLEEKGKEPIDTEQVTVGSVETWLEWNKIDVHANIELQYKDRIEWHAVLIENKVYTTTHDEQLKRYKSIFDEAYKDGEFKKHRHYVLITCRESVSDQLKAECEDNVFRCIPILDLFPNDRGEDTKSDIFNEFWLREWG